jgi:NADH dehydrogenase (ubiquinone) 1 alpha subcomplex subunit 2
MAGRRLASSVKELRLLFCQSSGASEGVRSFVLGRYKELKGANPETPILLREATGTRARLVARLEHGREESVNLDHAGEDQVSRAIHAYCSNTR